MRNILSSIKTSGKTLLLQAGTIVKAHVIDIDDKGNARLRISIPGASKGNSQGKVLKAFSEVPLLKGQNIFLEIMDGKNTVTLRIIGDFKSPSDVALQNVPARFLEMLARLSSARIRNAEFQQLLNVMKSLPQDVRAVLPEFKNLEKLLLDRKQLDGKVLKAFVESSGVAFETRLKIAVMNDPGSVFQGLLALQADGDLKAFLLRLKKLLLNQSIIKSLKAAGHKISDMTHIIEQFLDTIEFFQLTSKLNDMFYTFLPVLWDDLKDSEFQFKKRGDIRSDGYTCDINLDLESLGKLSVSILLLNTAFYVTFHAERPEVRMLIDSQKHILEKRFSLQGLPLKAIRINQKKKIVFGQAHRQEVDIRI